MRRGIGCGALALALCGCSAAGAFQCSDDGQCQTGDAFGICQPNGFCSFDDPACESGQRYGEQSGGLAGQCVDVGGSDASTGADVTTGDVPMTTSGAETTGGPASTDDGGTTVALDGTSTGPADTTSGPGTDTGTDASSGGEASCVSLYSDEFDDDVLDPLYDGEIGLGMSVHEAGGELHFEFDGAAMQGYSWIGRSAGAFDTHRYWVEFNGNPPLPSPSSLDVCLGDGPFQACVVRYNGQLEAYFDDGNANTVLTTTIADPVATHFVALSVIGGELRWEVSADGTNFTAFHTIASPFDPAANMYLFLGAGNWEVLAAPGEYALEALGVCEE